MKYRKVLSIRTKRVTGVIRFALILYTLYQILYTGASPAHADFSLGVYPPVTSIHAQAPTTVQAKITFSNGGDTPVSGNVTIVPFKASEEANGLPEYLPSFVGNDAAIADKISLSMDNAPVSTLIIPPQDQRTLLLTISLPDTEPDGDYYFSVIFASKANTTGQSNASAVSASIASHVLLSIGANTKPEGYIDTFSTPFFVTGGPVPFQVIVGNTGTVFFAPQAVITIKNMFGQTVGALQLLPVNVLAASRREIPMQGTTSSTASQTDPVWQEKALFGIYTVTLTVALSDQGPLYTQTHYLVAVPWYALFSICAASLLLLFIILRIHKRLH